MKLKKVERWMLSNQCRILEALYPNEAGHYSKVREAIERGYELHYDWFTQNIFDGQDTMTSDESREVINILDMFDALGRSFSNLSPRPNVEDWQVTFAGFDGNNEAKQLAYARYFGSLDGGRFSDVENRDANSHMPSLERYRRQLAEWEATGGSHTLSREQIERIGAAAIHPSQRDRPAVAQSRNIPPAERAD